MTVKVGPEVAVAGDIALFNGGTANTIDLNDGIVVTFDEAIDPTSINASLTAGGSVTGITAGVVGNALVSTYSVVTAGVVGSGVPTPPAGSHAADGLSQAPQHE